MAYPPSPATFGEFVRQFGSEGACIEYLARWRWPDGFVCPCCGSSRHCRRSSRPLWECLDCGRQTSVTAGTALHRTKVSLQVWVYAMWLIGRRKKSISALQLQRETGIGSYRTAWALLHKVRRVLSENDEYPLTEDVEADESLLTRSGARGRRVGAGGSVVVAAVERRDVNRPGRSYQVAGAARVRVIPNATAPPLHQFIEDNVALGARLITDGWSGYRLLYERGYDHDIYRLKGIAAGTGQDRQKIGHLFLPKVHLFFSNLKTWLKGTFHGVSQRYLPAYLNEYTYRFSRRHRESELFGFIVRRAVKAAWTPISGLTPEPCA